MVDDGLLTAPYFEFDAYISARTVNVYPGVYPVAISA
jgi:hypothetical protein